jgi:murein L,D-transpeptidase YcbB/YkuD
MAETVYSLLIGDGLAVEVRDDSPVDPAPIEIEDNEKDPRKVTLYCSCGQEAAYKFKAAKRVLGLCSSSACMRQALETLERWSKAAKSRTWDLISEQDVLDPPAPKLSVKEEIQGFQLDHNLIQDGILGPATREALRQAGRSGMIQVWEKRLQETAEDESV